MQTSGMMNKRLNELDDMDNDMNLEEIQCENMNREELIELNKKLIEKIKQMKQMKPKQKMTKGMNRLSDLSLDDDSDDYDEDEDY
jgi:hypothetical protein